MIAATSSKSVPIADFSSGGRSRIISKSLFFMSFKHQRRDPAIPRQACDSLEKNNQITPMGAMPAPSLSRSQFAEATVSLKRRHPAIVPNFNQPKI